MTTFQGSYVRFEPLATYVVGFLGMYTIASARQGISNYLHDIVVTGYHSSSVLVSIACQYCSSVSRESAMRAMSQLAMRWHFKTQVAEAQ